jgi:hypothetical protein
MLRRDTLCLNNDVSEVVAAQLKNETRSRGVLASLSLNILG